MIAGTRHVALLGIVLAYVALAATYNLTDPIFEAPDEIWHYLYVRNLAEGRGLPYQQRKIFDVLAQQEAAQPPLYYAVAAVLTFWAPRGDVAALAVGNPSAAIGDLWTDGNKNRFLHGVDQGFPWHGEVLTIHLVRFVSTAWGILVILLAYAVGRAVLGSAAAALASAAAVAFTPQFVFMSAAVNNDVAVAATAALLVLLVLRTLRRKLAWRWSILLGLAGGAVILSKPIAAGCLPLVAVSLWIAGRRAQVPPVRIAAHVVVAAMATILSCGWWFVYNVVTYGSPVPLQSFLGRRNLFDEMPSLRQVLDDLTGLKMSYWAVFGWFSVLASQDYYRLFDALMVLAVVGLTVLAARAAWHLWIVGSGRAAGESEWAAGGQPDWLGIAFVVFWVLSVLAALLFYRLIVEAFQGRLLFGATVGISILLALGWSGLAPRRFGPFVALALAGTLAIPAALIPWTVLSPAYARPPVVEPSQAHPSHPLNARLGDEVRLLGADISPTPDVQPGSDLTVTLYLQGLRPIQRNYTLFLKVLDAKGPAVASVDTYPGRGALPTTFWEPGKVVVDRYRVHVAPSAPAPSVDRLIVGMYWRPTMEHLPAFDADGKPQGGAILLDQIVVRNPPDRSRAGGGVLFGDSIALVAHGLDRDSVHPGATVDGYLLYEDRAPLGRDYTIFVHLVGPTGLIAQDDSPPERGAFPTSFWRPGDLVRHEFHIALAASTPPGEYDVVTGWYDLKTGQRLTTLQGDAIKIGTVRVTPSESGG